MWCAQREFRRAVQCSTTFSGSCAGSVFAPGGYIRQSYYLPGASRRSSGNRFWTITNCGAVPASSGPATAFVTRKRLPCVTLYWVEGRDAISARSPPPYTMVLMTGQHSEPDGTEAAMTGDIVGQAVSVARRAYVHDDHVVGRAQPPDRDLMTFLGYVIAHELGHLMLPGRRHAASLWPPARWTPSPLSKPS